MIFRPWIVAVHSDVDYNDCTMTYPKIALLVVFACCAALLAGQPAEEKPLWHADWPTAQRIALKTGKPVFAVMVCKH
jgi:hypothetical protein